MYFLRTDLLWPTARGNVPFATAAVARLLARDHSTVVHGVHRIAERIACDRPFRLGVTDLRQTLDETYEQREPAVRRAA